MTPRMRPNPSVPLPLLLLALAGCSIFAPTVTLDEAGPESVYEELNAFVLSAGELSTGTRDVLHAAGLAELAEDDPRGALSALHGATAADPSRPALFALSELSFLLGDQDEDRDAFLASAVYAWHYLLGDHQTEPPSPYDRRFRWACDLYNGALMRGLAAPDGHALQLEGGRRELPIGSIELTVDRAAFPWTAAEYPELLPADRFHVRGLTLRLRDPGLGVALIAVPDPKLLQVNVEHAEPGSVSLAKTPASVFLRVEGSIADTEAGLTGTLELYQTLDARTLAVGDDVVPLESDFSVVLAHALHRSPLWKFSLRGLFQGDAAVRENRLFFVRTPVRGRIPVVFVHGTASNPAYWVEMFNVLLNDPLLRARTQCWFFQYASGNPLLYSAMTLREQLESTMAAIDPEGTDPDLNRMVLIGHSQGGLVVKLMVVDGGMEWLAEALERPLDEIELDDAQTALLERAYEFDPLPFVERAVFVATPQQGSFLAERRFARLLAKLIALPGELQGTLGSLLADQDRLPADLRGRLPTSLDNMNPSNPLVKILSRTPIDERVTAHSIIAIRSADPDDPDALALADDGVVAYTSAHFEPVASERLVPTSHSCQSDPATISEVRRILREHVREP